MLPCSRCKAECCYLVPIHKGELAKILEFLSSKPKLELDRLSSQKRPFGMCPFVDLESYRCSVYEARPYLCRGFGEFIGLPCPHAPHMAIRNPEHLNNIYRTEFMVHGYAGMLGDDITWGKGLSEIAGKEVAR